MQDIDEDFIKDISVAGAAVVICANVANLFKKKNSSENVGSSNFFRTTKKIIWSP